MCYSDAARPPLPPIRGGATDDGALVLTAADGTRVAAHGARAAAPSGAGVVILPDARGLHHFYQELAVRFAEAGLDTVAIDYFGRTAGLGERGEDFEFRPHVERTTPAGIAQDTAAAVSWLRSPEGGAVGAVFTVGFCFGGSNSWNQAAAGHDLRGSIGLYGQPARSRPFLGQMQNPLLVLIAGADFTPPAEYDSFDAELTAAGVAHEMHTYPGAPHSFFDRTFAEHREACDDAWRRMLDFIDRHRAGA